MVLRERDQSMPVCPPEVARPVVHQAAPTLEEITPRVGRLGGVLYRMGGRGLDYLAGCARPLLRVVFQGLIG